MSFPEVVPDSSPEVLPTVSEHHGYGQPSSHSNPKYAVPVDRNSDVTAPNTYYDSGLIPVASIHRNKFEETGNLVSSGASGAGSRHRGMICGLRRKPFWLVLGISLAVIIVGIAGGVGGAMAAASSRKAKENNKAVSATAGDNAAAANRWVSVFAEWQRLAMLTRAFAARQKFQRRGSHRPRRLQAKVQVAGMQQEVLPARPRQRQGQRQAKPPIPQQKK